MSARPGYQQIEHAIAAKDWARVAGLANDLLSREGRCDTDDVALVCRAMALVLAAEEREREAKSYRAVHEYLTGTGELRAAMLAARTIAPIGALGRAIARHLRDEVQLVVGPVRLDELTAGQPVTGVWGRGHDFLELGWVVRAASGEPATAAGGSPLVPVRITQVTPRDDGVEVTLVRETGGLDEVRLPSTVVAPVGLEQAPSGPGELAGGPKERPAGASAVTSASPGAPRAPESALPRTPTAPPRIAAAPPPQSALRGRAAFVMGLALLLAGGLFAAMSASRTSTVQSPSLSIAVEPPPRAPPLPSEAPEAAATAPPTAPPAPDRIRPTIATASSVMDATVQAVDHRHVAYDAHNVIDGRADTWWGEAVAGDGAGEWVEVAWSPAQSVVRAELVPGYDKVVHDRIGDRWPANNRLRTLECELRLGDEVRLRANFVLPDRRGWQTLEFRSTRADSLRIRIGDVYPGITPAGGRVHDTGIAEIVVWGRR